jgi:hypothetical protein
MDCLVAIFSSKKTYRLQSPRFRGRGLLITGGRSTPTRFYCNCYLGQHSVAEFSLEPRVWRWAIKGKCLETGVDTERVIIVRVRRDGLFKAFE